jgi:hypothetical protein
LFKIQVPAAKTKVVLDHHQLQQLHPILPEQYNLSVINSNVDAFLTVFSTVVQQVFCDYDGINSIERKYLYTFDSLLYQVDVSVLPTSYKGYLNQSYNLRFSNDGFLYLPDTDYAQMKSGIKRHHGENWSSLQPSQCHQLPAILCFVTLLLGTDYGIQFFYCQSLQRMDLKFINRQRNRCLTFSFEPGYPAQDSFEDYWFEDRSLETPATPRILTEGDYAEELGGLS